MNPLPIDPARVLIASNSSNDAELAHAALRGEFTQVVLSVHAESAVADFEACRPDVMVLAFQDLALADRHAAELHASSALSQAQPPRTMLLCRTADVPAAYQLCKAGRFDDYAQFWPLSFDAYRLPMSLLQSVRSQRIARELKEMAGSLLVQARALISVAGAAPPPAAPAARPYVLLVEDDEFQQKIVSRLLTQDKHEVRVVACAADALTAVGQRRPDLILLDYRLPDSDGTTLLRSLRALPGASAIPVVMLTGNGDKQVVVDCMQAGADDFMVKPVSADRLREKLERHLAPLA